MISSLTGKISHIGASSAQIVVSGVGFSFFATPGTLLSLRTGKETTVFTSLVVREDSLSLFGFVAEEEQRAFEILQSVRGIGSCKSRREDADSHSWRRKEIGPANDFGYWRQAGPRTAAGPFPCVLGSGGRSRCSSDAIRLG